MSSPEASMSYMLRDRPDGQVEIILQKPILIGVFPEQETAKHILTLLQEDEAFGQIEDLPANFAVAAADVAEAEAEVEVLPPPPQNAQPRQDRRKRPLLPAVVEQPRPPVFLTPKASLLSEADRDTAFTRITNGEKISVVALEFGVSPGQMQGMWSQYKRRLQKHIAEAGQISCVNCKRPFIPSISHPETCARCSHD